MNQKEQAHLFAKLHAKGDPVILFNIWDAGSARAVKDMGAKAIATGSWSVAAAHGFNDGQKLPLDLAIANLKRIVASVDLPVSLDFEGGYAESPTDLKRTVTQVMDAGAIGINFEDQIVGGKGLYSIEVQCSRLEAIRQAADSASVPLFINARTDIFLKIPVGEHRDNHLNEAIERAAAYARSGASGFFAPGLRDANKIRALCEASPLPVNILVFPDTPSVREMAQMGVARISYGPQPYRLVIEALQKAASAALNRE